MAKNPVVAAIAVIVLVVALFFILRQLGLGTRSDPAEAFWYDVDKGVLFPHVGAVSPIEAPSGGEGVRAFVFACNSCDDDNDRFIGYLERYSEEGKGIIEDGVANNDQLSSRMRAMEHHEVRRQADADWYLSSEEIDAIKAEIKKRCGGKDAIACKTFQD